MRKDYAYMFTRRLFANEIKDNEELLNNIHKKQEEYKGAGSFVYKGTIYSRVPYNLRLLDTKLQSEMNKYLKQTENTTKDFYRILEHVKKGKNLYHVVPKKFWYILDSIYIIKPVGTDNIEPDVPDDIQEIIEERMLYNLL